jgi:hypothetical protein
MTADPPVGERELDADGWPVGMTREQLLAEAGISPELAAECERLATLSEAEVEAMVAQRREELMQQIGTRHRTPSPGLTLELPPTTWAAPTKRSLRRSAQTVRPSILHCKPALNLLSFGQRYDSASASNSR